MQFIDRLVTALTVLFVLPAVAVAAWLLWDQPVWVLWIVGPAVGGLVGAAVGWVFYGF